MLRRSFVSRDRRVVLAVGIGELSIRVAMMLECLCGTLVRADFAFCSKLTISSL